MAVRVVSALIAAAMVIASYIYFHANGLIGFCFICAVGCVYEYTRLTLEKVGAPKHIRFSFFVFAVLMLVAFGFFADAALHVLTLISVVFLAMSLSILTSQRDLDQVWQIQSLAVMGFVYVGIFPAMTIRLLQLEQGNFWLFGLLAIVFSGDTFAYFFGRALGKHKLLEAASPKKTVEGALGGLLGSGLAGFMLGHFFLTSIPIASMVALAVLTGAFAQAGDLFESVIKRMAEVKDSGRIMPGHGGFLDRLDGVLFGAPILYVLSRLLV